MVVVVVDGLVCTVVVVDLVVVAVVGAVVGKMFDGRVVVLTIAGTSIGTADCVVEAGTCVAANPATARIPPIQSKILFISRSCQTASSEDLRL